MKIDRRDLLRLGGAFGLSVALPSGVEAWLSLKRRDAGEERVLVLVELTGGNDGLNTIVPFSDDRYHRARPTLRIPAGAVHKIDDAIGFAPPLAGLARLFADGRLVVVQGVGIPNPDRSHFTSLDRWHTGRTEETPRDAGWVSRGIEATRRSQDPLAGFALGERVLPRLLQHHGRQAMCCESLAEIAPPAATRRVLASAALARLDASAGSPDDRRLAASAKSLLERLDAANERRLDGDAMPATRVGGLFADALRILLSGIDAPAIFVRQGGFDTHARQAQVQPQLLADVDGGLIAFAAALKRRGLDERVLVIVYSEFGRRVAENGSRGTDHGSGAPVILMGGGLAGRLLGNRPDLGDLDDGDVRVGVDFRRVLAQGLKHMGHPDPARDLGAGITPLI